MIVGMSSYRILPYSQEQAKKIGVIIKPSTNPKKKVDVFKGQEKVASIGDILYTDYAHLLLQNRSEAEKRRKAYKARHGNYRSIKGSAGWYADRILW
jgi:hypothetical protein